ncbi:hypothetical protein BCV69DRAFT_309828 [Microstroma glucosiphilum]|uniref:SANTA domain-containing protein n=1 Tax=Pseudomicrostroma glucosiphilum TaxID=1684307 RepID=A0A316UJ55_9BASI|nr:hypothetical protein BCV69DRAFT_309828 [Pseudomicrostroma glucosiphilum]PWN23973.1 hypothetical protein BCV69DRAFT_309828 [Pseudomicrostroma glucosiphilum]
MDPRFRVPSQGPHGHPHHQQQRSGSVSSTSGSYYPQPLPHHRYNGDGYGPETPRHDRSFLDPRAEEQNYTRGGTWSTPSYRNPATRVGREEFFGTPLPDRVSRTFDQLSRQYREGTGSRAGSAMPPTNLLQTAWRYDSLGPSAYNNRAASVHIGAGPSGPAPWSPARHPKPVISESTLSWLRDTDDAQPRSIPAEVHEQDVARQGRVDDSVEAPSKEAAATSVFLPRRQELVEETTTALRDIEGAGIGNQSHVEEGRDAVPEVLQQLDEVGLQDDLVLEQQPAVDDSIAELTAPSPPAVPQRRKGTAIQKRDTASRPADSDPVESSQIAAPSASAPTGPPPIRLENWNLTMVDCKEPPGQVVRARKNAASLVRWVYVQGIKTEAEPPLPWRTSVIAHRVRPDLVQTSSGSTYQLVGHLDRQQTRGNGFSQETADAFEAGFPEGWIDVLVKDLGELDTRQALAHLSSSRQSPPQSQPLPPSSRKAPVSTPKAKKAKTTAAPRSVQVDSATEPPASVPRPDDDDMMDFFDDDVAPDELTILATPKVPAAVRKAAQKRGRQSTNVDTSSLGRTSGGSAKKVRIGGVSEGRQNLHALEDDSATGSESDEEGAHRRGVAASRQEQRSGRSKGGLRAAAKVTPPGRKAATPRSGNATSTAALNSKQRQVSRELLNLGRSPFGMMKAVKYAIAQASPDPPAPVSAARSTATTPSPHKQRLSWGKGPEDTDDDSDRRSGRRSSGRARRAPDPKWWIVSPGVIKVEAEEEDLSQSFNQSPLRRKQKIAVNDDGSRSDAQHRERQQRRITESMSPVKTAPPLSAKKKRRVIEDTPEGEDDVQQSGDKEAPRANGAAPPPASPSQPIRQHGRSLVKAAALANAIDEDDLPVPARLPGSASKLVMTPQKALVDDEAAEDELAAAEATDAPSDLVSSKQAQASPIKLASPHHESPRSYHTQALAAITADESSDLSSLSSLSDENGKASSGSKEKAGPPSPSQPVMAAGKAPSKQVVAESDDDEEWDKAV